MSAATAPVPDTIEGLLAQNRAYRSLCASLEAQMSVLTGKGRQYQEAISTLDSEREANARLTEELDLIANEARRYAGHYQQGSDGRNTFVMFAEWVERRK